MVSPSAGPAVLSVQPLRMARAVIALNPLYTIIPDIDVYRNPFGVAIS